MKSKITISSILSLLMVNLVSAYNGYGGGGISNFWYYLTPTTILENEWFIFGAIFIITFILVYLALFRVFLEEPRQPHPEDLRSYLLHPPTRVDGNKGPIVVISLVIALLISAAVSQRSYVYGFLGQEIGSWLVFILFVMITISVIVGAFKLPGILGKVTGITFAIIFWLIWRAQAITLIPYSIYDTIIFFYESFIWILWVIVIIWVIKVAIESVAGFKKEQRRP